MDSHKGYARLPDKDGELEAQQRSSAGIFSPTESHVHSSLSQGLLRCESTRDVSRFFPGRPNRVKKGRAIRWLVIHSCGAKSIMTMEKRQLIQKLSLEVPYRDLRLMDPVLLASFESLGQLLVRDNAIVLSMEYVQMVITADKVVIPLDDDVKDNRNEATRDLRDRFIGYLEALVLEHACTEHAGPCGLSSPTAGQSMSGATCQGHLPDLPPGILGGPGGPGMGPIASAVPITGHPHPHPSGYSSIGPGGSHVVMQGSVNGDGDLGGPNADLPFELQMLEAGLGEICNFLAREVDDLKAQATPALDRLTRNADFSNLERVRKIKTSHQQLINRVSTMREALKNLMEDDQDMLRMSLSRQGLKRSITPAISRSNVLGEEGPCLGEETSSLAAMASMGGQLGSSVMPGASALGTSALGTSMLSPHSRSFTRSGRLLNHGGISKSQLGMHADAYSEDHEDALHDLYDVENLLESYFTLVDSTYQNLVSIGEYIDDTEDLVNIQLDYSRNKLLHFDVVMTTATFSVGIFGVVAGILGENLVLPEVITQDLSGFLLTNFGVLVFIMMVFGSLVALLRYKRLI